MHKVIIWIMAEATGIQVNLNLFRPISISFTSIFALIDIELEQMRAWQKSI